MGRQSAYEETNLFLTDRFVPEPFLMIRRTHSQHAGTAFWARLILTLLPFAVVQDGLTIWADTRPTGAHFMRSLSVRHDFSPGFRVKSDRSASVWIWSPIARQDFLWRAMSCPFRCFRRQRVSCHPNSRSGFFKFLPLHYLCGHLCICSCSSFLRQSFYICLNFRKNRLTIRL